MGSRDDYSDESSTGNDPLDQADWDFCTKSGYEYGGHWDDDDLELDERADAYRRAFQALVKVASPQERIALRAALAQLKAGQPLNWEAIARDLGKTSGAVKTQIRRAAAKLLRDKD
jgi:DNA-directed RNA polymerase specialized sigma24 family protein